MLMITTYYVNPTTYLMVQELGLILADVGGPLWSGLLFDPLGYVGIFVTLGLFPLYAAFLLCFFRSKDKMYAQPDSQVSSTLTYFEIIKVPVMPFKFRECIPACFAT